MRKAEEIAEAMRAIITNEGQQSTDLQKLNNIQNLINLEKQALEGNVIGEQALKKLEILNKIQQFLKLTKFCSSTEPVEGGEPKTNYPLLPAFNAYLKTIATPNQTIDFYGVPQEVKDELEARGKAYRNQVRGAWALGGTGMSVLVAIIIMGVGAFGPVSSVALIIGFGAYFALMIPALNLINKVVSGRPVITSAMDSFSDLESILNTHNDQVGQRALDIEEEQEIEEGHEEHEEHTNHADLELDSVVEPDSVVELESQEQTQEPRAPASKF